jgi:hypothetical protein
MGCVTLADCPFRQVSKLVTGVKIVSFPILNKVMTLASSAAKSMPGVSQEDLTNNAHAKKIEAFYSSQAEYVVGWSGVFVGSLSCCLLAFVVQTV